VAIESETSGPWIWTLIGYSVLGWSAEIIWTALYAVVAALRARERIDWRLAGTSYLWMFPIYGAGGLLFEVVHRQLAAWSWPWPLRGVTYMLGCFAVEYVTGAFLKAVTGRIPWDYQSARWNVHGLIRLDYAPVWFAFGLLLEVTQPLVQAFSR
jgi:uncharacterized membrane protein